MHTDTYTHRHTYMHTYTYTCMHTYNTYTDYHYDAQNNVTSIENDDHD